MNEEMIERLEYIRWEIGVQFSRMCCTVDDLRTEFAGEVEALRALNDLEIEVSRTHDTLKRVMNNELHNLKEDLRIAA